MSADAIGTDADEIDGRTRRAAEERLLVDPRGNGTFDVYSESGHRYEVFLPDGLCTCRDFHHRHPAGGCKHVRRVLIELGERPVPDVDNPDPMIEIHRGGGA